MVCGPTTGTSNSRCWRRRDPLTSRRGFPSTKRRRAAKHRVGAFHGLHRNASPLGDGDALPDIVLRKRGGNAAAVVDIALLIGRRLASRQNAFRGQKILQQQGRIGERDAFVRQDLGHAADQSVGVLGFERRQQLHQAPVRHDGGENLDVLHLPAHHHLADAFLFADVDQLAQRAQRDPVAARGQRFDFGRRFFLDRDGDHFHARLARRFQREHREASVAGDHSQGHKGMAT